MNIHQQIKIAEDMGLPKQFAIRARQRYLTAAKTDLRKDVIVFGHFSDGSGSLSDEFATLGLIDTRYNQIELERELQAMRRIGKVDNGITDEMITDARNYPVDKLVDFNRGKAIAFCHDDKNPSLVFLTRKKLAWCPVCDIYYNSVDVLVKRDGYNFKEAVKCLSGQ